MLEINPLLPHQWPVLKSVRLRALADAPEAFSTTLAQAAAYTDQEWQERAGRFAADPPATARIACWDDKPCGMICCYLSGPDSADDPPRAGMTSFWVAPEQRRSGVGRALVAAIMEWTRAQGRDALYADVTQINAGAIAFYRRLGFLPTGRIETDAHDPAGNTIELVLTLA